MKVNILKLIHMGDKYESTVKNTVIESKDKHKRDICDVKTHKDNMCDDVSSVRKDLILRSRNDESSEKKPKIKFDIKDFKLPITITPSIADKFLDKKAESDVPLGMYI